MSNLDAQKDPTQPITELGVDLNPTQPDLSTIPAELPPAITLDTHIIRSTTAQQVTATLEDEDEERDRRIRFENAFNGHFGLPYTQLSPRWEYFRKFAVNKEVPMSIRYETCRGILFEIMSKYGVTHLSRDSFDSAPVSSDAKGVISFYKVLEAIRDWFGPAMPAEDFNFLLRRYVGGLANTFAVESKNEQPYTADGIDLALERINELAEEHPGIVTPEILSNYQKRAEAAIRQIVLENIDAEYFLQDPGYRPRAIILRLARKYDIELPSAPEVWKAEVAEQIKAMEEMIEEVENSDHTRRFDKDKYDKYRDRIVQGVERYGSEVLPTEFPTTEALFGSLNARLKAARAKNAEAVAARSFTNIEEELNSSIERINISKFAQALQELKRVSTSEQASTVADRYKQVIAERLTSTIAELTADPSKAVELGKTIQELGRLRQILEEKFPTATEQSPDNTSRNESAQA